MEKFFRFPIRIFSVLFPLILAGSVQAQQTTYNGTQQAPNFDFETWDNPEPWGWNSSSCHEADLPTLPGRWDYSQSVWAVSDARPGSKGIYSTKVKVVKSKFTYYDGWFRSTTELMGTLTTGTLWYKKNRSEAESCIYTSTDDGSKNWPFTGRPDSIVFWVKSPANGGRQSDMTLYLHSGGKLEDRNPNGTTGATVIGSANVKIPSTNNAWVRYSVPVTYQSSDNPAYLLLSFTAGNNFREVVEGDELYVDDVFLVYNPDFSILPEMQTTLVRHGGEGLSFEIPFSFFAGTTDPFNASADNQIVAYLSDAEGNFDQATEVARATIHESGTLQASLPADFPDSDKYRLKLVSTNYPLESNIVDLQIYREWFLSVKASNAYGQVETKDKEPYRHLSRQTLTAQPGPDCVFLGWEENGQRLSTDPSYTVLMDADHDLTAVFDTTYTLEIRSVTGANVFFANNNTARCTLNAGDTARLRLQLDFGYAFYGFLFEGDTLRRDGSSDYDFPVRSGGTVYPLVDSIPYAYVFEVWPSAKLGSVEGNGIYKHFGNVRAVARPVNPYSRFQYWSDTLGNRVGIPGDTVLVLENIQKEGYYRAVFQEETHSVSLSVNEPAWGKVYQNGEATASKVYSAVDSNRIVLSAVPEKGYAFQYWENTRDGVGQEIVRQAGYVLLEKGHLASDYVFTAVFDTAEHTLEILSGHGKVSGEGIYRHGETAVLTARADEGYHFAGWKSGDGLLSFSDTLRLGVFSDTSVTALFELNRYRVDIRVSDTLLGNVDTGSAYYYHFDTLSVTALPAKIGELRYWLADGDTVGKDLSYSRVVTDSLDLLAVFSYRRCRVDLASNEPLYGWVGGSGLYEWGSDVELRAEAFAGYVFEAWEDAAGNRIAVNPIRIDSLVCDTSLRAVFSPRQFTVRLTSSDFGEAYVGDPLSEEKEAVYDYMQEVWITAVPESQAYEFQGWYDEAGNFLSEKNPEHFRAVCDTSLRALFGEIRFSLNLSCVPAGAGILQGAGRYKKGESVEVSVEANPGYDFAGWYLDGERIATETEILYEMDTLAYLTARFNEQLHSVNLSAEPADKVSHLEGAGSYRHGYNTRLYAQTEEGYEVFCWVDAQGDTLSCDNPFLYAVKADAEVRAAVVPALLDLSVTVVPASAGTAGAEECRWGQETLLQARAAYGYAFDRWTDLQGREISLSSDCVLVSERDTAVVAVFRPLDYQVSAVFEESEGRVRGGGTFAYGSLCRLQAEAGEHYRFSAWLDDRGNVLGLNPVLEFRVCGNLRVKALFEKEKVSAVLSVEPLSAGRIEWDGHTSYSRIEIPYQSETRLSARENPGYTFDSWRVEGADGTYTSDQSESVFTLLGGEKVTAVFRKAVYGLDVAVVPEGAGRVEGAGPVTAGQSVLLRAVAADGYVFKAYRNRGEDLCFDTCLRFRPDSSLRLEAVFERTHYALHVVPVRPEAGSVSGSGIYAGGQEAVLSAWSMDERQGFSHWSSVRDGKDTLSRDAEYRYAVQEDDTVFAFFAFSDRRLDLQVCDLQTGWTEGTGLYPYGTEAGMRAQAFPGYHFVAWYENGLFFSSQAEMTVPLYSDRVFRALFAPDTFQLELQVRGTEDAEIFGAGSYAYGDTAYVLAGQPPFGLVFEGWQDQNGDWVGRNAAYAFPMDADKELTAVFGRQNCRLQIAVTGKGKAEGTGDYAKGDSVLLCAQAEEGWLFSEWKMKGFSYSQSDTVRILLYENLDMEAVFVRDDVSAVPTMNTGEGGNVLSPERAGGDETVWVKAVPYAGYRFLYWSLGDEIRYREARCEVPAEEVPGLVAHFAKESYRVGLWTSDPQGVVSLQGAGSFRYGQEASVAVELRDGYVFEGWFEKTESGEKLLSADEQASFPVVSEMEIEARIARQK